MTHKLPLPSEVFKAVSEDLVRAIEDAAACCAPIKYDETGEEFVCAVVNETLRKLLDVA